MYMTHYMELLTTTSNLLIFMALPVVLAETAAITELILLFSKENRPKLKLVNKLSCLLGAAVFLLIDIYILKEVIVPLTENSGWYGLIDKIAVGFYVLGGLIMVALGVVTLNTFRAFLGERFQRGLRVGLLSAFLVISHVAMIAGMADPRLDSDYRVLTEERSAASESMMSADTSFSHSHGHEHH
ncbi:DUF6803 family protein [Succinivibrio sp.]|uniref:DUF6803 family protein n=1 Tax=Succinivibrio sp. TaxID=2053619 RepID=UPI003866DBA5